MQWRLLGFPTANNPNSYQRYLCPYRQTFSEHNPKKSLLFRNRTYKRAFFRFPISCTILT